MQENQNAQSTSNFESALDQIQSPNGMATLSDLENMVNQILSTLPRLDRAGLRNEMEKMNVPLHSSPTTKSLHEGLSRSQGYKDRLSEIYTLALREYKTRSRCVEMLFDAVNLVSNGKSADKRKGEATMRYPMQIIQLEAAEIFMKEVEHILQNIKSSHEAVSRQISLMQIQLQLGEIRREMPKTNSNNPAEEISGNLSGELSWNDF